MFNNYRQLAESITSGKTWLSTFRKVPSATATISGQWFDYSYAGGNPIPNYYAASPLESALLEPEKGIIVPQINQYLHCLTLMTNGATASNQVMYLLDYLLYYPFVDMDAAGEEQTMTASQGLTRYTDGIGAQMMCVAQSPTVGGGRFTITYIDTDGNQKVTQSLFCAAAQPAGALVHATANTAGVSPFVPLVAGGKGVKSVVSCNFSVANGGLMSIVLVRPIETSYVLESTSVAGLGAAVEKEAVRLRGGLVEIKSGAFLGIVGQGSAGSLASSPLVGVIETVWN